jgi:hypothetical protein
VTFSRAKILSLKNRHSGECCILANGPSLNDHDLKSIPVPTIGLNAAWQDPKHLEEPCEKCRPVRLHTKPQPCEKKIRFVPRYHVVAETIHELMDPDIYERFAQEGRLIAVGGAWPSHEHVRGAVCIPIIGQSNTGWSNDLTAGVVISHGPSGTVTLAALQVAKWLGYSVAWMVGLDLGGKSKFNGRANGNLEGQRKLFTMALPAIKASGLDVRVIGKESRADMFERYDWPWGVDEKPQSS